MDKETIIRKLTSRKLWLAVALFISGLIVAFGGSNEVAETVSGCIMQGAAVLGYLLAEGLTDAKHAGDSAALPGIDVEFLTDDQLRSVLYQMGLQPAEDATREEMLNMLDKEAFCS